MKRIAKFICLGIACSIIYLLIFKSVKSYAIATPEISITTENFIAPLQVKLETSTPGAEIHYTLDGTKPTLLSMLYTKPFTLSESVTIQAKAFQWKVFKSALLSKKLTNIPRVEWKHQSNWWNSAWHFRLPILVDSGSFERIDKLVELAINFTQLFSEANAIEIPLDLNSIRVVEVTNKGQFVSQVNSQFERAKEFNATTNAAGKIIWMMSGTVPKGTTKYYHLYFDSTVNGFKPKIEVSPLITRSSPDKNHWKFSTPYGYYTFEKSGGTFSIFAPEDVTDNTDGDWVRFDHSRYQGIPNMHSPDFSTIFHQTYPGLLSSNQQWQVYSHLIDEGSLKTTLRSNHKINSGLSAGEWEIIYDVFPSTIRCTVTKGNAQGFALIQEATPGGNKYSSNDFLRLSTDSIARSPKHRNFNQDISPEWAYQGDSKIAQKLYFIHLQDDQVKDAVLKFPQYDFWVVGWGRGAHKNLLQRVQPGINIYPASFYFGFYEAQDHEAMLRFINSTSQPLKITSSGVEILSN